MKFFSLYFLLSIIGASSAFADDITYSLKRTNCAKFTDQMLHLNSNILTDVDIKVLSCEDTVEAVLSSRDRITAVLSTDFKACDTETYIIKSYQPASYEFVDHQGLSHIMTAVGLLPLGRSLQERGLENYGIPVCN